MVSTSYRRVQCFHFLHSLVLCFIFHLKNIKNKETRLLAGKTLSGDSPIEFPINSNIMTMDKMCHTINIVHTIFRYDR